VGTQTVTWKVREGDWSVVLMNSDGSRGIAADIDLGAGASYRGPRIRKYAGTRASRPLNRQAPARLGRSIPRPLARGALRQELAPSAEETLVQRVRACRSAATLQRGLQAFCNIGLPRRCHRVPPKCKAATESRLGEGVSVEHRGMRRHDRGGS
jgi:hypothetical protein